MFNFESTADINQKMVNTFWKINGELALVQSVTDTVPVVAVQRHVRGRIVSNIVNLNNVEATPLSIRSGLVLHRNPKSSLGLLRVIPNVGRNIYKGSINRQTLLVEIAVASKGYFFDRTDLTSLFAVLEKATKLTYPSSVKDALTYISKPRQVAGVFEHNTAFFKDRETTCIYAHGDPVLHVDTPVWDSYSAQERLRLLNGVPRMYYVNNRVLKEILDVT